MSYRRPGGIGGHKQGGRRSANKRIVTFVSGRLAPFVAFLLLRVANDWVLPFDAFLLWSLRNTCTASESPFVSCVREEKSESKLARRSAKSSSSSSRSPLTIDLQRRMSGEGKWRNK